MVFGKVSVELIEPRLLMAGIDLAWDSLAVEPEVYGGLRISASYRIANDSSAAAADFSLSYVLSANQTYGDGDDIALSGWGGRISDSAGKSAGVHDTSYEVSAPGVPSPGVYWLLGSVDSAGEVSESDESNNVAAGNQIDLRKSDLSWFGIGAGTGSAKPGESIGLYRKYSVTRQDVQPDFTNEFRLSRDQLWGGDDDIVLASDRIGQPGDKSRGVHNLVGAVVPSNTPGGAYWLLARADAGNAVDETDEDNNVAVAAQPITIVAEAERPDLRWNRLDLELDPSGGFNITRDYQVLGQADADFAIEYVLSANQTFGDGDDLALDREIISGAADKSAGGHARRFFRLPADWPAAADYSLLARLDSGSAVAESDEGNNNGVSSNRITIRPTVGSDFAQLSSGRLAISGTSGDDRIDLTSGGGRLTVTRNGRSLAFAVAHVKRIEVDALDGNDRVSIGGGIIGAYVLGGTGNDTLLGGDGADSLTGAAGRDRLEGGSGPDRLAGSRNDDVVLGGGGDDRLYGEEGNDRLEGLDGRDRIYGDDGADEIFGGSRNDTIYGDGGDDRIDGGGGSDRIWCGQGGDTANGGRGNDVLYARDVFRDVIGGGVGTDRVIGDGGATEVLRGIEYRR